MDPSSLIVIVIAICASAFFSGMEIAFITANRLKIELDSQKGSFSGRVLANFVKNDSRFIATMLLGNNIALVVYGIWMAKIMQPWIEPWVGGSEAAVLLVQTILSTLLILVTAEFIPKATFQINPNRVLQFLSFPLALIYGLLYPLTIFTMTISNGLLNLFGMDTKSGELVFSKIDLDDYVRDLNERMEDENELDNEMQILQNAIGFSDVKARDCMIPRTEIVALDIESSIDELRIRFIETGLSKILIYRDTIDNIIGYVHSFELFKKPKRIKEVLIPIGFVPEAVLAKNLLELFAKQHGNIAVVVDEYGGTSGLITIEDVVEEIFGDIEDEHDMDQLLEQQIDETTYLFSARQDIDHINETYGFELEESSEYETLGGLVLHYLESIPEEGTVLELEDFSMRIEAVSDRRIEVIRLKKHTNN
ncbi:hemolysin family protein [Brumimicrobium aurantiacum]|uniref:HlyC/CorC family transporter n=1 Tax=Brumimicrobium aurantiacum TaxID=1737063 RepID=A0A3E1F1H0_9FLAO|nr:hemolysin family protein [Brumimicrobium aurantiacum]RFC55593.1 HlyC/CorC family transporter [Brumimicrobium aurantiacum]